MKTITKDKYKITFVKHKEEPTYSIVSGKIIRQLLKECGFSYPEIDEGGMELQNSFTYIKIKRVKMVELFKCKGCGYHMHNPFPIRKGRRRVV
jgi:hypothetical protein